jgi:acyl-coenzyme A thioesterase PaaI-like protein
MNMTAPGEGERLIARGWVKRPGRTLIVTHGDVFVIKDNIETLCATMLQTIMVLPESESRPAG